MSTTTTNNNTNNNRANNRPSAIRRFRQTDAYSSAKLVEDELTLPWLYKEVDFHTSNGVVELFSFNVELPCPEKLNSVSLHKFQLCFLIDPVTRATYDHKATAKFFLKEFHKSVFDKIITIVAPGGMMENHTAITMINIYTHHKVMLQGTLIVDEPSVPASDALVA